MKSFFKTFFACLAAIFTSVFLLYFIAVMFVFVMMFSVIGNQPQTSVKQGSVLTISLTENISDKPEGYMIEGITGLSMKIKRSLSLYEILNAIDYAKRDNNIAGIFLNIPPDVSLGLATTQEIRRALEEFKGYGKFVLAHASSYSQGTYYLSSVADKVFLYPEGDVTWKGLASQTMFFKGTLDKLGVEPEIIRHGKYKSAVEPFTSTGLSAESEYQMTQLVGDIWNTIASDISASRGIDTSKLNEYASKLSLDDARAALRAGFVDSLVYNDQVLEILGDYSSQSKPRLVSLADYVSHIGSGAAEGRSGNLVAVVYVEGDIMDRGKGQGIVTPAEVTKMLKRCREDDDVKAVVLRVNSPGGSALAADIMWREVEITRQVKPVVVSMGDYAASGGYYVSAPGDLIVAGEMTITGSIGVFGLMFNAEKGLNDKLGITVDGVKTHASSDAPSIFRKTTAYEKERMQKGVDNIYGTFVEHVAAGRNLSVGQVDSVAQGRVWSGAEAVRVCLADSNGGLMQAIAVAADKAGISDDYTVEPQAETPSKLSFILQQALQSVKADSPVQSQIDYYGKEFMRYARMLKNPAIYAITPVMVFF